MIHHLNGILASLSQEFAIIDVNGIGYQVFMPQNILSSLPITGSKLKVYTYHHIREDQQTLFGFLSREDRNIFNVLTSVSGIGPKVGIAMLGAVNAKELISAIIKNDINLIQSIPGLGKKKAERIILELKDKLPKLFPSIANFSATATSFKQINQIDEDLSAALKTLGYSNDEIKKAYQSNYDKFQPEMPLEESLKILLKNL